MNPEIFCDELSGFKPSTVCFTITIIIVFNNRVFLTRLVYLYYISCLRYIILVGNPRYLLNSSTACLTIYHTLMSESIRRRPFRKSSFGMSFINCTWMTLKPRSRPLVGMSFIIAPVTGLKVKMSPLPDS